LKNNVPRDVNFTKGRKAYVTAIVNAIAKKNAT